MIDSPVVSISWAIGNDCNVTCGTGYEAGTCSTGSLTWLILWSCYFPGLSLDVSIGYCIISVCIAYIAWFTMTIPSKPTNWMSQLPRAQRPCMPVICWEASMGAAQVAVLRVALAAQLWPAGHGIGSWGCSVPSYLEGNSSFNSSSCYGLTHGQTCLSECSVGYWLCNISILLVIMRMTIRMRRLMTMMIVMRLISPTNLLKCHFYHPAFLYFCCFIVWCSMYCPNIEAMPACQPSTCATTAPCRGTLPRAPLSNAHLKAWAGAP